MQVSFNTLTTPRILNLLSLIKIHFISFFVFVFVNFLLICTQMCPRNLSNQCNLFVDALARIYIPLITLTYEYIQNKD